MSHRKRDAKPEPFVAAAIPTENHIVTRDGRPCTLINVSGMAKGGVLIPGSPIVTFAKCRDAARAIERTIVVREKLSSSLVSEWMTKQIPSFLSGKKFEIVPAGHQGGDPRLIKQELSPMEVKHGPSSDSPYASHE